MVIGIVVHPSRRGVFEQAARTLSGVTLEWVIYEDESEIGERVGESLHHRHVDGLLLGPVPYTACRDRLPDDLPVAVVRPSELDLALAFFQAAAQGWKPVPVSIDTFEAGVVAEVTAFLRLDTDQIASLPYAGEQSATDIVAFHRRFLDRARGGRLGASPAKQSEVTGKPLAGYIISARTAVFRELDGTLPMVGALSVPSTIRRDLHELALRIQSERASALRFAAAVFHLVKHDGDTELDRARVGLMNMLLNTPEFSGAWVDNRGRNGVVVLAHRAQFERITREWTTVQRFRAQPPPRPAVRSAALVLDCDHATRSTSGPGGAYFEAWMRLREQGLRPAVLLAARAGDSAYLTARGIWDLRTV